MEFIPQSPEVINHTLDRERGMRKLVAVAVEIGSALFVPGPAAIKKMFKDAEHWGLTGEEPTESSNLPEPQQEEL